MNAAPHGLAELFAKRIAYAAKATQTKRDRYPDRYYKPGEPRPFYWQNYCHRAVTAAKACGILPDLSKGEYRCTDCEAPAFEYDHRDYSRPLGVDPVCRSCNNLRGKGALPGPKRFHLTRMIAEAK